MEAGVLFELLPLVQQNTDTNWICEVSKAKSEIHLVGFRIDIVLGTINSARAFRKSNRSEAGKEDVFFW